jgi:uncharacterized membrane protein
MTVTWILGLAIIGIIIAGYIYYKKTHKQQLVCMIGDGSCDDVVHSKYSQTFGVPNEIGGMLYYVFVILGSLLLLSGTSLIDGFMVLDIMIVAGLLAALFSVYLLFVQFAVLKEWCEYCMISSAITIVIFVIEVLL